jgi:hypothetical protein
MGKTIAYRGTENEENKHRKMFNVDDLLDHPHRVVPYFFHPSSIHLNRFVVFNPPVDISLERKNATSPTRWPPWADKSEKREAISRDSTVKSRR